MFQGAPPRTGTRVQTTERRTPKKPERGYIRQNHPFTKPPFLGDAPEQLPCRSAEVKYFSVFLCQRCREIWREILVKFSEQRFPGFGCATENFTSKLREAKPGGFPNPGVSHFFRERSRLCRGPLSGLFLVGALNRPRKRKRTNRENPRTIPEQIGKIPEKSGKSRKGQKRIKKEGQVQIGKPPRLKPPRLAALDKSGVKNGKFHANFTLLGRSPEEMLLN